MTRAPMAALGLALAVGGCSRDDPTSFFGTTERSSKETTTLYVNASGEPEYLDPGKCTDTLSEALVVQLFEGLTSYGPRDGHPVQGAAERWEQSDDNRLFRFYLRPGARWSDGQPLTARDFEYAWKRVLRPSTASRGVTNLYPVLNGELWSQGKLKAIRADRPLLSEPRRGAPARDRLPQGTAVRILGQSPRQVTTAIAPLAEVPAGVRAVRRAGGDDAGDRPEELGFEGARPPAVAAADGGWRGATVDLLEAGPAVDCDDAEDRWFLIRKGSARGYLPGCLLSPSGEAGGWALVERHEKLPTFTPSSPSPPSPQRALAGFVAEEDLVEDDGELGVRALDDLTLDVELERPTPYFIELTTYPTLFPVRRDVVEAFERRGEAELWVRPGNIVSNGPYALDDWRFRYEITMRQNPHYWNHDKLKIQRIVWLEVEEHHATMNLYKTGEIDFFGDDFAPPPEYMPTLEKKKDFIRSSSLSTYWYELNTRAPPLNDVHVRRALNLAIDKEQLVQKVTRGGQIPATHYVPELTGLGYSDRVIADKARGIDPFSGPEMEFNPARARALMKEAGYEVVRDGDGYRAQGCPSVEILYNIAEDNQQIAIAIQDMWRRHLGVAAVLRSEEWKVMLKNRSEGRFQVLRLGWNPDYDHPQTFLDLFLSGSPQNPTGWGDNEYDESLRRAAATPDPVESIRLYREAEAIAIRAMPRLPLYVDTHSSLLKPWVRGFWSNKLSPHLLEYLWIDPAWRQGAPNEPAFAPLELPPPGRITP